MPSKYVGPIAFKTRGSQHERMIASERVNDVLSTISEIVSINIYKPKVIELLTQGKPQTTHEISSKLKGDLSSLLIALHVLARKGAIKEVISSTSLGHNAKQKWSLP